MAKDDQNLDSDPVKVSSTPYEQVFIIGAGVLGLTIATLLQQRLSRKTKITIIANEFPTQSPITTPSTNTNPSAAYASMWAGAHYRPIPYLTPKDPAYHNLNSTQQAFHTQLAHEHKLGIQTATVMKDLARTTPQSGVQIIPAAEYLESPPPENLNLKTGDIYASTDDNFHVLTAAQLATLNSNTNHTDTQPPIKWACEYESYVVNVHIYCHFLLTQFLLRGGSAIQHHISSLSDLPMHIPSTTNTDPSSSTTQNAPSPLLILNCTGTGLPSPKPDPSITLIRGQTVLVSQPFTHTLTRQHADGTWSFLIPRPLGGGTIVGGTKQIGDVTASARPDERRALLENAARNFPLFVRRVEDFEVVCDNVGLRPWRRGGLRIEAEDVSVRVDGGHVKIRAKMVHLYGAGGRGYELSWGAAEEALGLVGLEGVVRGKL